jgi:hypothetical protein
VRRSLWTDLLLAAIVVVIAALSVRTSTRSAAPPGRVAEPAFSPSPAISAAVKPTTMVFTQPRADQKASVSVREALRALRLRPGPSVRATLVVFTEGDANPNRRPFFDHRLVWLVRVIKPQCYGSFHGQCQQPHNAIVDATDGRVLLLYST